MPEHQASVIENFTTADLGRVRGLVKRVALAAGLSSTRAEDLVLAVNELAVNAILHAGGGGSVTVWPVPGGVAVEVRDQGPGLPAGFTTELPDPDVIGGRGIWLVRRLCQQVRFTNGTRGTTVSLVMSRA
jgi:anti-sigma regulatory factor (Ser/Thr protein kinase)